MSDDDSLTDLGKENISDLSTRRLRLVLETLNEADELSGGLSWETEIWHSCTIEELLGGLIEAENLLEMTEEEDR